MTPRTLPLLFLLIPLWACDEDSPRRIVDPPAGFPPATTEDQLVQNLVDAFNARNHGESERLLHDDFVFRFADEDIDPTRGIPMFWDRARDVASTEAMFTGQEGRLDPETGTSGPPVQSIQLTLSARTAWTSAGIPAEYESERWREYHALLTVNYANGNVALARGHQRFYLKSHAPDGGTQVWRLRAWRDTGVQLKGTVDVTIGVVKASF